MKINVSSQVWMIGHHAFIPDRVVGDRYFLLLSFLYPFSELIFANIELPP